MNPREYDTFLTACLALVLAGLFWEVIGGELWRRYQWWRQRRRERPGFEVGPAKRRG